MGTGFQLHVKIVGKVLLLRLVVFIQAVFQRSELVVLSVEFGVYESFRAFGSKHPRNLELKTQNFELIQGAGPTILDKAFEVDSKIINLKNHCTFWLKLPSLKGTLFVFSFYREKSGFIRGQPFYRRTNTLPTWEP